MPGRTRRKNEDAIEPAPTGRRRRIDDDVDDADADDGNAAPEAGPSTAENDEDTAMGNTNNEEAEESDDAPIDVDAFSNQPIPRSEAGTLNTSAGDWGKIFQLAQECSDVFPDTGAALAEVDGDVGARALENMDGIVREMLDLEAVMEMHQQTLNDMYQRIARDDQITEVHEEWKQQVSKKKSEYSKKTTRQKYGKSEQYKTFKERIYEVQHDGEAMPALRQLLPREDGDEDSDDDEIEIGGATQNFTCPLTLTMLEQPMTSKACKHSYSRAAIFEYLGNSVMGKKCPASGCHQTISKNTLRDDPKLGRRVRDAARRQDARKEKQAAENEQDALEIDVDDED